MRRGNQKRSKNLVDRSAHVNIAKVRPVNHGEVIQSSWTDHQMNLISDCSIKKLSNLHGFSLSGIYETKTQGSSNMSYRLFQLYYGRPVSITWTPDYPGQIGLGKYDRWTWMCEPHRFQLVGITCYHVWETVNWNKKAKFRPRHVYRIKSWWALYLYRFTISHISPFI